MTSNEFSAIDPLMPLLAFHRRCEKRLAELASLASELRVRPLAPELCASAAGILCALGAARAEHHALEEARLLPSLERRIRHPAALEEFRVTRAWIAEDHERIATAWRAVRRPLEAIAEGVARPIAPDAVAELRAIYGRHIVDEETALHRFAMTLGPTAAAA
jgi:hypothetical protein